MVLAVSCLIVGARSLTFIDGLPEVGRGAALRNSEH